MELQGCTLQPVENIIAHTAHPGISGDEGSNRGCNGLIRIWRQQNRRDDRDLSQRSPVLDGSFAKVGEGFFPGELSTNSAKGEGLSTLRSMLANTSPNTAQIRPISGGNQPGSQNRSFITVCTAARSDKD